MKRTFLYLLSILALVSCQKDTEIPMVSLTVQDKVEAGALTASLSGAVSTNSKVDELYVQLSTDEGFGAVTEVQTAFDKGQFVAVLTNLQPQTTYYYRYRAVNKLYTFTNQIVHSFRTKEYGAPAGVEMVDLGLSVKWANMNVGATTVTGYGDYFAWGETSPKTNYNWSTYKYCNGSYDSMTKYCTSSSYGTVDNKTTLEALDDAAHVNWGGNWRMPTHAEQEELVSNCTITWTSDYKGTGVAGRIFTSKKTGYTDKSIFLPAAGCRSDTSLDVAGSFGGYWSSSLCESYSYRAWCLYFFSDDVSTEGDPRYCGHSVRAVCP